MNFKELPDMSAAYQEVQEKAKKLDPVGKEDGDINNDGKKIRPIHILLTAERLFPLS
ncbi:MAG: hypothetical protein CM15mV36_1200 [Caudoviricetes sp.]|nr:MAG: hypothetical protein CM15mV36_1200 [Caudoviricetes sp.]